MIRICKPHAARRQIKLLFPPILARRVWAANHGLGFKPDTSGFVDLFAYAYSTFPTLRRFISLSLFTSPILR